MASFRKHITKDGRTVYFWRAKVPVKEAGGSVVWQLTERSTKASTLAGARGVAGSKPNTMSAQVVPLKR